MLTRLAASENNPTLSRYDPAPLFPIDSPSRDPELLLSRFKKNNSSPTLARLEAWENEQPKQLYPVPLHSTTQPPFPTDSASRASPFSNQLKPRHEIDSCLVAALATNVGVAVPALGNRPATCSMPHCTPSLLINVKRDGLAFHYIEHVLANRI